MRARVPKPKSHGRLSPKTASSEEARTRLSSDKHPGASRVLIGGKTSPNREEGDASEQFSPKVFPRSGGASSSQACPPGGPSMKFSSKPLGQHASTSPNRRGAASSSSRSGGGAGRGGQISVARPAPLSSDNLRTHPLQGHESGHVGLSPNEVSHEDAAKHESEQSLSDDEEESPVEAQLPQEWQDVVDAFRAKYKKLSAGGNEAENKPAAPAKIPAEAVGGGTPSIMNSSSDNRRSSSFAKSSPAGLGGGRAPAIIGRVHDHMNGADTTPPLRRSVVLGRPCGDVCSLLLRGGIVRGIHLCAYTSTRGIVRPHSVCTSDSVCTSSLSLYSLCKSSLSLYKKRKFCVSPHSVCVSPHSVCTRR